MSILDQSPSITFTKTQKLNGVKNRILRMSHNSFEELLKTQNQGIKMLWEHPELTPQEIIDKLGADAIKVFQFHGALTDLILGIAAADGVDVSERLKFPKYAFTIDQDTGKITVDPDTPYTPS